MNPLGPDDIIPGTLLFAFALAVCLFLVEMDGATATVRDAASFSDLRMLGAVIEHRMNH